MFPVFTLTSFSEHIDLENLSGMAALEHAGKLCECLPARLLASVWEFCNPTVVRCVRKNHYHAVIPNGPFLGALLLLNRWIIWCRNFQKRVTNLFLVDGDRNVEACHVSLIELTNLTASSNCYCRPVSTERYVGWMDVTCHWLVKHGLMIGETMSDWLIRWKFCLIIRLEKCFINPKETYSDYLFCPTNDQRYHIYIYTI